MFADYGFQEHYLPYIIRSKVKLMLQGDEDQQPLLKFIDNSMKTPEPKAFLEVCDMVLSINYTSDINLMAHRCASNLKSVCFTVVFLHHGQLGVLLYPAKHRRERSDPVVWWRLVSCWRSQGM